MKRPFFPDLPFFIDVVAHHSAFNHLTKIATDVIGPPGISWNAVVLDERFQFGFATLEGLRMFEERLFS